MYMEFAGGCMVLLGPGMGYYRREQGRGAPVQEVQRD